MWIVELLIWALLIFSALFITMYVYNQRVSKHYTYYVFFHDIDGLIKGSPVKFQGYQVGYVSNISVINDEIFMTFIITQRDFEMPDKLLATVEFTGMGGSKSLELTGLGSDSQGKNIILVVEPRRIQDFMNYSSSMAKNIAFITADFMKLFNESRLTQIRSLIKNPVYINQTNIMLDTINKTLDEHQGKKKANEQNLCK